MSWKGIFLNGSCSSELAKWKLDGQTEFGNILSVCYDKWTGFSIFFSGDEYGSGVIQTTLQKGDFCVIKCMN